MIALRTVVYLDGKAYTVSGIGDDGDDLRLRLTRPGFLGRPRHRFLTLPSQDRVAMKAPR